MAQRCTRCSKYSVRRIGGSRFCTRHFRLFNMRRVAKEYGKYVPTWAELYRLIPQPFTCQCCTRRLTWMGRSRATIVTLQHDRNGRLRMICMGCNSRHASMPGDTFYSLRPKHKRCGQCHGIKPFSEFVAYWGYSDGITSTCRACHRFKMNKRYAELHQRGA